MARWRSTALAAVLVLGAGIVGSGSAAGARQGPCGTDSSDPPAQWDHVVLLVMENKSYSQIFEKFASSAPYIQSLVAQCGLATNYWSVFPKSLPNYVALVSGSTQGLTGDVKPADNQVDAPSLFSQLGNDWLGLMEGAKKNCWTRNGNLYTVNHNAALYFSNIQQACLAQSVPLGPTPDLSRRFTMIVPNLLHDMHATATTTTTADRIAAGDAFLQDFVPQLVSTPQYRAGNTAIFITWDEGQSTNLQVPLIVISPHTGVGARDNTKYTHYSLVRAMQEMMGLSPLLANAAAAVSVRGDKLGV
jgi:phospholipase C